MRRNQFQKIDFKFKKELDLTVIVPYDYSTTELEKLSASFIQLDIEDFDTIVPSRACWESTWVQEPIQISAEQRQTKDDVVYTSNIPEDPTSILAQPEIYVLADSGDTIVSPRDASWWVASAEEIQYERQHEYNPAQLELPFVANLG